MRTSKSTELVRIIGGKWRGRKLRFPAEQNIRPTPNRVRETVFNWLAPYIEDATCLDLFTGSGALGIEALSRGAAHTTFVDQAPCVLEHIKETLTTFGSEQFSLTVGNIPKQVALPYKRYQIVFIDPPFYQGLLKRTCAWLSRVERINQDALIYTETEAELATIPVPDHWQCLRSESTRHVQYNLFTMR